MSTTVRNPPGHGRTIAVLLVCVVGGVGVFEALWFAVVTRSGPALADPAVLGWVLARRTDALLTTARVVTDVGGPTVVVVATVLVVAWRTWRGDRHGAGLGAVGLVGLVVVDVGAKALVARPRPPLQFHAVVARGWSFPSGHAMLSAGALLLVVWLLRRRLPGPGLLRVVGAVVAVAFLAAVGASRVVLGVHYPSDVLAGWSLAVLVVAAVALLDVATAARSDA